MGLFRRAGAEILRVIKLAADPPAAVDEVQFYSKDVAGVAQGFARAGDGTISQLTPTGPWLPVEATVTPPAFGWTLPVVAGRTNPIATTNGGGSAEFPAASSVPNGTPIVIKLLDYSGSITLVPDGTDTIDGFSAGSGQLASYLDTDLACVLCVSNGVDEWFIIRDSIGE